MGVKIITCHVCGRKKELSDTRCPYCRHGNLRMGGNLGCFFLFLIVLLLVSFLSDFVADYKRGVVVETQELRVSKQVV